jgi:hypothetical protein
MSDDLTTPNWIDEAEAKIEEARAIIKEMVEWFLARYEDAATHTPYITAEGGYQWGCNEPYGAYEEIGGSFPQREGFSEDDWDTIVNLAVEEVEEAGGVIDWALIVDDYEPEPEPNVVRLLYASNHSFGDGRGHVHAFDKQAGKTPCGRTLETCPGTVGMGDPSELQVLPERDRAKRKAHLWALIAISTFSSTANKGAGCSSNSSTTSAGC